MAFRDSKKWETPPSTAQKISIHAPLRRVPEDQRARERAAHEAREREAPKLSRFARVSELRRYLERRGKTDACRDVLSGVTECDPWKYEGELLDDLVRARMNGEDAETLNKLRDLIWIGSVTTYERKDEAAAVADLNDFALLLRMRRQQTTTSARMTSISADERRSWDRRIMDAKRDPATLREREEDARDAMTELERVHDAITNHLRGPDLEPSVRTIEDLSLQKWLELKKYLAAHGTSVGEARLRKDTFVTESLRAIEDLRHVRDLLYYRRIHPDWAKMAIDANRKR